MILDTTVLVDILRGDPAAHETVEELEAEGRLLWVPTPVVLELFEGIERADRPARERIQVENVLEEYTVLPFEMEHARRAGTISGRLIRRGEMLDPLDVQIASVGLVEGHTVLTRNEMDLSRIPDLDVATY